MKPQKRNHHHYMMQGGALRALMCCPCDGLGCAAHQRPATVIHLSRYCRSAEIVDLLGITTAIDMTWQGTKEGDLSLARIEIPSASQRSGFGFLAQTCASVSLGGYVL